jgi:serine/threonine protein kinase
LLDFGLAKAQASDASVTASQAFYGYTRHYAPLEQIQDQRTDPRSDIYALGATLYHLLTGIKPPDAMVRAAAVVNGGSDPLRSADQIHGAVGPQIAAILNKAMAQKPDARYANAHEFREALRRMGRTNAGTGEIGRNGSNEVFVAPGETIHISEMTSRRDIPDYPVVKLALVGSAKRFGPAGATFVMALVVGLAGGIIYASQRWFPTADANSATPATDTAAALRQSPGVRKTERVRTGENISATSVKPANSANNNKKSDPPAVSLRVEKTPVVATKSPNVSREQDGRRGASHGNLQRVGAPSIRFPKPELRDNTPAPSPASRSRTYSSLATQRSTMARTNFNRESDMAPKFYRAADGTQIVKFSDGSTRWVHPGRQGTQSTSSYR